MSRPEKKRTVTAAPRVLKFSPRGVRGRPDKIVLRPDELEALRLCDLEQRGHADAARSMNISRQTLERILRSARGRAADGLVNGKIIMIDEGVA
ncbi:MAG: DUF134 domain-containing protein [Candidatus Omnitrophica bacterium]|nr:DUF134 domain-containing protein [Candidatus Omnitrophota bacterium]